MRVRQLIQELQRYQAVHGDGEVGFVFYDEHGELRELFLNEIHNEHGANNVKACGVRIVSKALNGG